MKTYRTAIIGTGSIAPMHVEALRHAAERVELVAAVSRDPAPVQQFCARHSIPRWYTDAGDMFATEAPDLVHICTPPRTHHELILAALEAGASVLCEKPLCASLAEFDGIAQAEARTGRGVSTVFQWRFGSGALHLKHLIEAGDLGKPLVGVCQTLWYRSLDYYAVPWRGKWATEIGGTSTIHGIHLIDLFLWLMGGNWREVQAMIGTLDRPIEVEDTSLAMVRFGDGALGSLITSVLCPRQESTLRLDFQRVTVELRSLYYANNADWRYSLPEKSADSADLARWQAIQGDWTGDHQAQTAAVLDSLDRGEPLPVSGLEARRILEFLASLYKSAFTRQAVERGSITPGDPFYYAMNGRP